MKRFLLLTVLVGSSFLSISVHTEVRKSALPPVPALVQLSEQCLTAETTVKGCGEIITACQALSTQLRAFLRKPANETIPLQIFLAIMHAFNSDLSEQQLALLILAKGNADHLSQFSV